MSTARPGSNDGKEYSAVPPSDIGLDIALGEALSPGMILRGTGVPSDGEGAVIEVATPAGQAVLFCRAPSEERQSLAASDAVAIEIAGEVSHELAQQIRALLPRLGGLRFRSASRRQLRVLGPRVTWDEVLDQSPGTLKIADQCDEACAFCSSVRADHPGGSMPPAEAVRSRITRWAGEGLRRLQFVDREPTLNPRLVEYIAFARSAGFSEIYVNSNGVRLAEGTLLADCAAAGMTELCLSLHAAEAALSDRITARADGFAAKLRTLRAALPLVPKVTVNCVVTVENMAELPSLARLVRSLGEGGRAPHLVLSFVGPVGDGEHHLELLPRYREVVPLLQEALDASPDLAVHQVYALPPCQLDATHRPRLHLPRVAPRPILDGRRFLERCDRCSLQPRCGGIWQAYLDRFGDAELTPIP